MAFVAAAIPWVMAAYGAYKGYQSGGVGGAVLGGTEGYFGGEALGAGGEALMSGAGAVGAADAAGGSAAGSSGGWGSLLEGIGKNYSGYSNLIGGLYGLQQSRKMQALAALPNPGDVAGMPGYQAGLEAVQRSMAAQGYLGSGNMMAALQKYGGDAYNQYVNQRLASAQVQGAMGSNAMSSLGLLTSGMGKLAGWGG